MTFTRFTMVMKVVIPDMDLPIPMPGGVKPPAR